MAEIPILNLFHGQNKQKRLDDNTNYHLRVETDKVIPRGVPPLAERR